MDRYCGIGISKHSLICHEDQLSYIVIHGCVTVGPALFLTCPLDVKKSQKWFTELWNDTVVPYLSHINKEFTVRVCVHLVSVHAVFAPHNLTADCRSQFIELKINMHLLLI